LLNSEVALLTCISAEGFQRFGPQILDLPVRKISQDDFAHCTSVYRQALTGIPLLRGKKMWTIYFCYQIKAGRSRDNTIGDSLIKLGDQCFNSDLYTRKNSAVRIG